MPSPIPLNCPVNSFLPLEFSPSSDLRPCSSPLVIPGKDCKSFSGGTPSVRTRRLPPRLAWCSIDWEQLCLLHPLGSGGFGSVYKATYHGATVAVKQVKKSSKNRLASRQSFWAELNVARLQHDNVVRVVAASTCAPASQDSLGTIVMEYVGNITLHHVIYGTGDAWRQGEDGDGGCGRKALSVDEMACYSCDIVTGLAFLHSQGIVHLDLKPANVFITEQGACKIGDFGCSQKLEEGLSQSPHVCQQGGTYTHRAPELLKGERVTAKADIYSFAITLWQIVTREQPYLGERQHVLYAVVAYNLRPSLAAAVFHESPAGRRLWSIISCCWKANAEERPSAAQLLPSLRALSGSL
ncbi:PREDICTED: proto-oncogene serine/threonine-protein kinase mos [Eurypyga helias]|uniref:Serine/threonine-protein kinase mos n=1 Tax=Eurypyga helias TaxID=54383 RepID=A0A093I5N5_EURHL|nr:PREDICTED: proto-oncogene serine/threonine-protein kinase mos [Eurypyga helias]KFV96932.1 Serine/threonine-protein kinase mos [Eurypyga helias]